MLVKRRVPAKRVVAAKRYFEVGAISTSHFYQISVQGIAARILLQLKEYSVFVRPVAVAVSAVLLTEEIFSVRATSPDAIEFLVPSFRVNCWVVVKPESPSARTC